MTGKSLVEDWVGIDDVSLVEDWVNIQSVTCET